MIIRNEGRYKKHMESFNIKSPKPQKLDLTPNPIRKRNYNLFNYKRYSIDANPYPNGKYRLNSLKLENWLSTKIESSKSEEETDNYIDTDELVDDSPKSKSYQASPIRPIPLETVGPRAMARYYEKYKGLNTINSPGNSINSPATFNYLKEVERHRRVPHPMGIVKWRGSPNELNLKYIFTFY